jgi:hypothetical protein
MHMMKTIDTDTTMAGLKENIILVLIQHLHQQALVLRQQAMTMEVTISISIKITLRRVLAQVQQLMVVVAIIIMVLRRVLAQVQLPVEEAAQQVRVLAQPLVVDQQQQVQAVPLQAELI